MRRALALSLAAGALAAPVAQAATPKVEVMVVGRKTLLQEAVTVRPKAVHVRVKRRKCKVADATPLAALEILRRAGGPSYALRDFGACSRRAVDAGGLFVSKVGPDRNKGSNGWVYKVGRRAGSAGAADAAGPFGTGKRLRSRQRVTWFWCVSQSSGGCQRTLEAKPTATALSPGAALTVTVRGYDDDGKGVKVAGATVLLGAAKATTGSDGRATLAAPATPGRYAILAGRAGMVRAFPVEVVVG